MATLSNMDYFAITRDDGVTWKPLPFEPRNHYPTQNRPFVMLSGKSQIPSRWQYTIVYDLLTADYFGQLQDLWDADGQAIWLNYKSRKLVENSDGIWVPQWYYGTAVWREPISYKDAGVTTYRDVTVTFHNVDWVR